MIAENQAAVDVRFHSQSETMVAEETIMICVDTSEWMSTHLKTYKLQIECVRSYCRAKLKSNPKNAIGIMAMGAWLSVLDPTSDLDKILHHLHCLQHMIIGGELKFIHAVRSCRRLLDSVERSKLKRILLFFRGSANIDCIIAELQGKTLKEKGVAVDVITFSSINEYSGYWKMHLEAFVAAVNNNNNSHINHVHPDSSTLVSHVLSRTLDIISLASLEEEEEEEKNKVAAAEDEFVIVKARGKKRNSSLELENNRCKTSSLQQHNDRFVKTRGIKRGAACKPLQLNNRFEALLHSNEIVKLGNEKNQADDDGRSHSQFETMVAEETIMICVDTSEWMSTHLRSYKLQIECLRSYCRAKLKSNPKNAIGIMAMGAWISVLDPTTDLDKILHHLHCLQHMIIGGELKFIHAVRSCRRLLDSVEPSKLKRILLFFRGSANIDCIIAELQGKTLKEKGVAVDVITFSSINEYSGYWKMHLEAFVAAVNNNNNSHINHVHPDSSTLVSHVLSSALDIIYLASIEEEEKNEANAAAARDLFLKAWEMKRGERNPLELKNRFEALLPS